MSNYHFWNLNQNSPALSPCCRTSRVGFLGLITVVSFPGSSMCSGGGLMWRDAPATYEQPKTLYNRFIRWSRAGVFDRIFPTLASVSTSTDTTMIDATHLKAHRSAASLLKKGLFPAISDVPRRSELQTTLGLRWLWQAPDLARDGRAGRPIIAGPRPSYRPCDRRIS